MLWTRPMWLIGQGMALDSMRRGFVGGTSLSLFVIKQFNLEAAAPFTLDLLGYYLEWEEAILDSIPDFLNFLTWPFQDYHDASMTYYHIMQILVEAQAPPLESSCEVYWEKEKETP